MKSRNENVSYPNGVPVTEHCAQLLHQFLKGIGYFSIFSALPIVLGGSAQAGETDDKTDVRPSPSMPNFPRRQRPLKPEFLRRTADYRLPYEKGRPEIFPSFTGSDDCPGTPIPAGSYTAAAPYTDTGDTTGANDTITLLAPYYYYSSHGPDRVYSFVVTSIGANPEITVTATSPTYRPMIYVTRACPAGTNNISHEWETVIADSRWFNTNTATISSNVWEYFLSLGRRYYLYIDSSVADEAGPYTLKIKDMRIASGPAVLRKARPDFDGDSLADPSIFRPSDGTWWIQNTNSQTSAVQFGLSTDKPVPEDYDGDGRTDVAIFRSGDWWVLKSSDATPFAVHWGQAGDVPVPGDYNGDGRAELAIFRNGQWWTYDLATGQYSVSNFGLPGDKAVPGDYDGDGRTDQAIFRSGVWHLNQSLRGYAVIQWGLATDKPVPAYYDWDAATDLAVYRDGLWYFLWSSQPGSWTLYNLGTSSDIPVPSSYFYPEFAHAALFRNGTWMVSFAGPWSTTDEYYSFQFGQAGDIPLPGNTP